MAQNASANHIFGTYRRYGFQWLATHLDYAELWYESNKCNAREPAAFARVTNTTAGTSEFAGKWPSGIRFTQQQCYAAGTNLTTKFNNSTDILLEYSDWNKYPQR